MKDIIIDGKTNFSRPRRMKRFIRHCKRWNQWRKSCKNNFLYKIYVFFNPKISPTYQLLISYEKKKEIIDAFWKGVEDGMKVGSYR